MRLGILNMRHLIVGQVGIKIITPITGGEESNPLYRIRLNQDGRASSENKISLTNLPILLLTLSMLQKNKVNHKVVLKAKLVKDSD